jgi:hypothetical protein
VTLSEILSGAYEEAAYGSSPSAAVTTRLTRWVNEGVRTILAEPGLARLADNDAPFQVASVANVARIVVPEAVARILSLSERTNDVSLSAMDLATYRRLQPDPAASTGTPTHFVPIGRVAVAVQPADASSVFIKSTAAETPTAYVEGVITGGYQRTTSTAMTGVTAKSIDSTITTWEEITDFYLSANAVGTVTLLEDSGAGAELARITIGQKRPRYFAFYLWPTPQAAITYYVDYRREVLDLVNATDEPGIPTDFHPILVAYAVMREREQKDDPQRYVMAKQQYDKWLSRLKYHTQSLSAEIPVNGRSPAMGRSRLGGFYPADVWTR